MKKLLASLILLLFLAEVKAQDSLAGKWLDEVVVTGQYEAQSARNSVYAVRVIPMEVIQARGAVKLEDVLNTQLNMRFSQDGSTGSARLTMQGLSGQSIKIMIDGVPVTGRQGFVNEIDINQINVQTVERIEIVEGPVSTMYGADALAGVINIITKKSAPNTWHLDAGVLEKSAGMEYGLEQGIHNQNLAGGYAREKWNINVNLTKNYFGGWQGYATGRERDLYPKDQIMASARVGFTPPSGEWYYRLDYLYENLYNAGPMQIVQALDEDYTTNRFMHQVQGSYDFSDRLRFWGMASYSDYSRRKRTIVVDASSGEKTLALGDATQAETKLDGIATRGTFLYKANKKINTQFGYDINLAYGTGDRLKADNKGIADYALFGSVEWTPLKSLWIRPGFRFTYNSVYKAPPVVPSVNVKWEVAARHAVRFSYGYGFRAPSLRELYFDFFDSGHSIEGNTDLKAETSHSFNATWDWQPIDTDHFRWTVVAGGFYNTVKNKIYFGQKPERGVVTTYINISNYQTQGITLRNAIRMKRVTASAGFSFTYTLFWSPEFVSTLSYSIPKVNLQLSFYYKYTGETLIYNVLDDEISDENPARMMAFHTADLTVQKKLFDRFTLTAGVQNLFDVTRIINTGGAGSSGTHGTGGTTSISYGRSYFVGLAYALSRALNTIKSSTKTK